MPGDPPAKGGDQWRFESSAVVGWLREKERQSVLGEVSKIDEHEAKRRKLAAEAAMAELELAKKQGIALGIADFEASWAAMIGAARAKLLGLGAALGPEVALSSDPDECSSLVESGIAEALQELSEFESDIQVVASSDSKPEGGDAASVEVVGATARPDSKRMGRRRAEAVSRVKR